jgi:hypothetical protein
MNPLQRSADEDINVPAALEFENFIETAPAHVNFGLVPLIRKYGKIEATESLGIRADEYSQRSGERAAR